MRFWRRTSVVPSPPFNPEYLGSTQVNHHWKMQLAIQDWFGNSESGQGMLYNVSMDRQLVDMYIYNDSGIYHLSNSKWYAHLWYPWYPVDLSIYTLRYTLILLIQVPIIFVSKGALRILHSHWKRKYSAIRDDWGCSSKKDPPLQTIKANSSTHLRLQKGAWVTRNKSIHEKRYKHWIAFIWTVTMIKIYIFLIL